ncbi:MAG: hypothetical protein DMF66_02975, partial [Acidobacteria bacterium]
MILQFSDIDYQDLDLARFALWLDGADGESIQGDVTERSKRCGLSEEVINSNAKIQELIHSRIDQNRGVTFRTPLSDWHQLPFLIDRNEKPVTAANAWIRHISRGASPKTIRTYAYALYDFFQYLEANDVEWCEANDDTLFSYRLHQETTDSAHKKKHKGSRRVSRGTIQMRILTAGRFFKYATLYGYIEKNPLTYEKIKYSRPIDASFLAHLNRTQEKEIPVAAYRRVSRNNIVKWLPHETVWTWINSIKNERDKLIAKLLYQTGMRREEIILWKVDDIPEAKGLPEGVSWRWVGLSIRGKGGKERQVRISF